MSILKRSLAFKLLFLFILMVFAVQSHALMITPGTGAINVTRWEIYVFPPGSTDIEEWAQARMDSEAGFLYKSNEGGVDEGILAGSYQTSYYNEPTDPADANINYVGGDFVGPTAYLLVKDGNASPTAYLFNLTALSWNGTDILELRNFWPDQGAISYVALYGTSTPIPEPGTMLLLGLGLVGIAGVRKRFTKK